MSIKAILKSENVFIISSLAFAVTTFLMILLFNQFPKHSSRKGVRAPSSTLESAYSAAYRKWMR